jgi:hypothetical protein
MARQHLAMAREELHPDSLSGQRAPR